MTFGNAARVVALGLASAGLFAAGALWHRHAHPAPEAAPVAPAADREVLRFASGAPQLAMLQIAPAPLLPLPLAEPLNARIAYDEDRTTRLASPVPGRIVDLRRQVGDRVAPGEVLAIVDSPDLGAAMADLAKARADERRKSLAFARSHELFAGDVLPRKDLEAAEADFASSRAETLRAELRLANLNPRRAALSGQRMVLASPFAGVVADRRANPGMEVRPDMPEPLFVVTDPSALLAVIDVPEAVLSLVKPGQKVVISVDAYPDERFAATVDRIPPVLDPAVCRVQARARVANPDGRLRPEMYARATLLPGDGRQAVRVPNGALVTQGVQHFVFVERAAGELVRRRVDLAHQDREFAWVTEGLAAGERVVGTGALLLQSELAAVQ